MENSKLHLSPSKNKYGRFPILTNRQINVAAFLFFLLVTIIIAWPVVSNLNNVMVGDDNDTFINLWVDWWTGKALSDPNISLWYTEYLFHPLGANLVYHSFSHLNSLFSLGLRPFVGALAAFNITILFNLVLIGFSVFQLTHYLTKSAIASLIAGLIFAFNSQIIYQTAHPVLLSVWCFPWAALYLIRAVRENSYRLAVAAGIFVFLGATVSVHIFIQASLMLLLLVGYMVVSAEFPRPPLKILLAFGLTCLVLVIPIFFPLIEDAIANQNTSFSLADHQVLATDIASIFTPPREILLKRSLYLGFIPIGLFFLALLNIRRAGKFWFLLALFSFLIVIGPTPTYGQQEFGLTLPWLEVIIPIIRHPYRFLLIFAFAWSMMGAYGWLTVEKALKVPRGALLFAGLLVGLLILLDYAFPQFPHRPVVVSPFYTEYLEAVPNDEALAIIPFGRQEDKRYLFYQTLHEHPITGGHISRSEAETLDFINQNPLLRAGAVEMEPVPIPDNIEEGFRQLADVNVHYFIIDKNLMVWAGRDFEVWRAAIPFFPIYEDDLLIAYKTTRD